MITTGQQKIKLTKTTSLFKTPITILLIPVFFSCSYLLLSAYTSGDQTSYIKLYNALKYTSWSEVTDTVYAYTSSRGEPITAYLLWLGASFSIDKNIFISILNTILCLGVYLIAKRNKVPFLPTFLLLTNFYLIVLATSAERLKIAYILLVWGVLFGGRVGRFLIGISPFAHLQNFILLFTVLYVTLMKYIKALVLSPKLKKSLLFSLLAGAISICSVMLMNYSVLFSFLSELWIQGNVKFFGYQAANSSLSELFNIAVLFLVVIFVTKDPKRFYGLFTIQ
jgi:hypothetical protein